MSDITVIAFMSPMSDHRASFMTSWETNGARRRWARAAGAGR